MLIEGSPPREMHRAVIGLVNRQFPFRNTSPSVRSVIAGHPLLLGTWDNPHFVFPAAYSWHIHPRRGSGTSQVCLPASALLPKTA
jgi:hypothetical protein